MTMETLRENARNRLVALCNASIAISRGNRLIPATLHADGRFEPAPTLEFIGARTVEINAKIDAYMYAIKVLDEEYKRIVDPSSMEESEDDPMDVPDPNERVY
jgi:hypothetical protein